MKWQLITRNVIDATAPRACRPAVTTWDVDQLRAFLIVASDDEHWDAP